MKNKVLSILFIFIFISFLFINNSFAANDLTPIEIVDEKLFNLIYDHELYKSGDYHFFIGGNDMTTYKIIFIKKADNLKIYIDGFNSSNSSYWLYFNQPSIVYTFMFHQGGTQLYKINGDYSTSRELLYKPSTGFYSTIDVYNDDSYTDYFLKLPEHSVLAQALDNNNPNDIFKSMISSMIPYLLVFLVGLIAFWKAWRFLSKEFRKA